MKLSPYTFVKDGLFYDLHVLDMLKHHLPLAGEMVVNEGFSSDGAFEAIAGLHPKIKVIRNQLDKSDPKSWSRKSKDQARRACTGDWCVLMDCDEFLPEWEFDRLHAHLEHTDKHVVSARYKHFYGNYRVLYERPDRPFPPRRKWIIHRNRADVEIFGDRLGCANPGAWRIGQGTGHHIRVSSLRRGSRRLPPAPQVAHPGTATRSEPLELDSQPGVQDAPA